MQRELNSAYDHFLSMIFGVLTADGGYRSNNYINCITNSRMDFFRALKTRFRAILPQ